MNKNKFWLSIYIAFTIVATIIAYDDYTHGRFSCKEKKYTLYVDCKHIEDLSSESSEKCEECKRYYFVCRDGNGNKTDDIRVSSLTYYKYEVNELVGFELSVNTFRKDKISFISVIQVFNLFVLGIILIIYLISKFTGTWD